MIITPPPLTSKWPHLPQPPWCSRGFGLVEVLVAILVLAIGLLGIAGLQAMSVRLNHDAQLQSQATLLATDVIDRIRANREGWDAGDYIAADIEQTCDRSLVPSGSSVAERDLDEWGNLLACYLPGGSGAITTQGTDIVVVHVSWMETDTSSASGERPDYDREEVTLEFRSRLF